MDDKLPFQDVLVRLEAIRQTLPGVKPPLVSFVSEPPEASEEIYKEFERRVEKETNFKAAGEIFKEFFEQTAADGILQQLDGIESYDDERLMNAPEWAKEELHGFLTHMLEAAEKDPRVLGVMDSDSMRLVIAGSYKLDFRNAVFNDSAADLIMVPTDIDPEDSIWHFNDNVFAHEMSHRLDDMPGILFKPMGELSTKKTFKHLLKVEALLDPEGIELLAEMLELAEYDEETYLEHNKEKHKNGHGGKSERQIKAQLQKDSRNEALANFMGISYSDRMPQGVSELRLPALNAFKDTVTSLLLDAVQPSVDKDAGKAAIGAAHDRFGMLSREVKGIRKDLQARLKDDPSELEAEKVRSDAAKKIGGLLNGLVAEIREEFDIRTPASIKAHIAGFGPGRKPGE